jgi:hypothetical protein
MTPDPMTWGDPSEVAGYIQSTTKPSPFEGISAKLILFYFPMNEINDPFGVFVFSGSP